VSSQLSFSSGTATVVYSGLGVISGQYSVVYDNYSDDGRDFVNGTSTVTNPMILTGPIKIDTDLTMTGANTGYSRIHLVLSGSSSIPVTATGTAVTSYDGTTVSGPPHVPAPCPNALPRAPHLKLTARLAPHRHRHRRVIVVHVTAAVAGAGANEAGVDTQPVWDATITVDRRTARTDRDGTATLAVPPNPGGRSRISARAGDTLVAAGARIRLPRVGVRRRPARR
jgi:hypothetical protein